jgi:hypothetical protein
MWWSYCPDFNYTDIGEGKSFADDLNKELGIVSCRVTLLLRSTEIKWHEKALTASGTKENMESAGQPVAAGKF